MKKDKKSAIKIVTNAAKEFETHLNARHFLIVYQNGINRDYVEISFRSMNFLHLTGIKSHLSAQRFYEACLDGKLSEQDIEIDTRGKVEQKLSVLPYLSKLLYNNCMIGNFIDSGVLISADYFIGDTRRVLSLGFRKIETLDIPVSLFREDVRKLTRPTCKVIAIFCKNYKDPLYREITYLSKGVSAKEISIPGKLSDKDLKK